MLANKLPVPEGGRIVPGEPEDLNRDTGGLCRLGVGPDLFFGQPDEVELDRIRCTKLFREGIAAKGFPLRARLPLVRVL